MSTTQPANLGESTELAKGFFDHDARVNPYPLYRELRERGPIHWTPQGWLVVNYEGCLSGLTDGRLSTFPDVRKIDPKVFSDGGASPLLELLSKILLFTEGDAHSRLRNLLAKAFAPRSLTQYQPTMEQLASDVINAAVEKAGSARQFDFAKEIAEVIPVLMLCAIVGVPAEDAENYVRWSNGIVPQAEGMVFSEERFETAKRSARDFVEYSEALIDDRRASPHQDLLSEMVFAQEEGDRLTREELVGILLTLIIAGSETTISALGNSVIALDGYPEHRERLAHDGAILKGAVEELLRFDGPGQAMPRTALEDLEFCGAHVEALDTVFVGIGAGNHDPLRFPDPERLDFERENLPGLGFGYGTHFCLGAALVRLEMQVILPMLYQRLPSMAVTDDIEWKETFRIRGPQRLVVTW